MKKAFILAIFLLSASPAFASGSYSCSGTLVGTIISETCTQTAAFDVNISQINGTGSGLGLTGMNGYLPIGIAGVYSAQDDNTQPVAIGSNGDFPQGVYSLGVSTEQNPNNPISNVSVLDFGYPYGSGNGLNVNLVGWNDGGVDGVPYGVSSSTISNATSTNSPCNDIQYAGCSPFPILGAPNSSSTPLYVDTGISYRDWLYVALVVIFLLSFVTVGYFYGILKPAKYRN